MAFPLASCLGREGGRERGREGGRDRGREGVREEGKEEGWKEGKGGEGENREKGRWNRKPNEINKHEKPTDNHLIHMYMYMYMHVYKTHRRGRVPSHV